MNPAVESSAVGARICPTPPFLQGLTFPPSLSPALASFFSLSFRGYVRVLCLCCAGLGLGGFVFRGVYYLPCPCYYVFALCSAHSPPGAPFLYELLPAVPPTLFNIWEPRDLSSPSAQPEALRFFFAVAPIPTNTPRHRRTADVWPPSN
eukprot:RCo018779